ncbi:PIG-L family deacetylase [Thermus oshimai]|jgi:LmbE family N-acetylglucosaminyl deacetylase|uniref:Putative LmbE-like protein n=1 Tax=Thermus oshimai JL-2 TaxID=751945 RepID=K7RKR5_THEOS|nr:PIG-L family deacetylase [Thermus oshimai]AFV77032.1 putative LmbE-like protein [Thermus oshimai JL-2]
MDLLVVVPHPDDETFGAGGALLLAKAEGLRTGVIALTRGEAGRTLGLCPPERLGEVRAEELRKAAEVLGVDHLEVLSFPNGLPPEAGEEERGVFRGEGLMAHPEAVEVLRARFLALRPRFVLTFPPDGINGHPDHVATSRYVREAAEGLRLVYFVRPDGPWPVTHRLRLPEWALARKLRALAQHKTQALSVLAFMERYPERLWTESFFVVGAEGLKEGPWW